MIRVLEVEDVIRLLRSQVERAGSQAAFAKNAGVDRATISKILSGRAPLQPKVLRALNIRMVFVLASKNELTRKHPISRKAS